MKETTPMVSVLMPVYNGMPYLPQAVESILNQTFTDFEFIIVNDCSNDDSLRYLQSVQDARVVLVQLLQNKGVTGALQEGMSKVRGKYIARLDADDIAKPHRLRTQVDYLENIPDVGLLGSSIEQIDSSGNLLKHVNLAKDDLEIRWKMLFKNPFFHSTTFFRSDIIKKYKLDYAREHGEDYQLWVDLLKYCQGMITNDLLIQYRTHQKSWTFTKEDKQVDSSMKIAINQLAHYLQEDHQKLGDLIRWAKGNSIPDDTAMIKLFVRLMKEFIPYHKSEITSDFIVNRLRGLKSRIGSRVYLRFDLFPLYSLLVRLKFRHILQMYILYLFF